MGLFHALMSEQELHEAADAELQAGQNQTAPAFLGTLFWPKIEKSFKRYFR